MGVCCRLLTFNEQTVCFKVAETGSENVAINIIILVIAVHLNNMHLSGKLKENLPVMGNKIYKILNQKMFFSVQKMR